MNTAFYPALTIKKLLHIFGSAPLNNMKHKIDLKENIRHKIKIYPMGTFRYIVWIKWFEELSMIVKIHPKI